MQKFAQGLEAVRRLGRKVGPYLMLEILLPGGTLFAILLYVYRRSRLDLRVAPRWTQAIAALLGSMLSPQPAYARAPSIADAAERINPNGGNR